MQRQPCTELRCVWPADPETAGLCLFWLGIQSNGNANCRMCCRKHLPAARSEPMPTCLLLCPQVFLDFTAAFGATHAQP